MAAVATEDQWLSIADLAEMFGIAERTIRNGRSTGRSEWSRLRFHKIGSRVLVRRSDLEEWLETCVADP